MLGARLFATSGASAVAAQVGRAGQNITPPGQLGAVAGDYAILVHANPPSGGWANLSGGAIQIFGRVLSTSDLALNAAPSDDWGLAIYRDVTSAAIRPASGFAKSAGFVGIAAAYADAVLTVTSPAGMQTRITSNNPYFALYDLVDPTASYQDGTPFRPGTDDNWAILELLRV